MEAKDRTIEKYKDVIRELDDDKAVKDEEIEGLKEIIKQDEDKIAALMQIINRAHEEAHEVAD